MPIRIKIRGLEDLDRKLGAVVREFPQFLSHSTTAAVLYVHSKMPKYPAQPAGSTYRRTGTLGRSVTTMQGSAPGALSRVESSFGDVKGIVGTRIRYATWVIDRENQTPNFRAYWWNLQDTVIGLRKGIRETYKKELNRFFKEKF